MAETNQVIDLLKEQLEYFMPQLKHEATQLDSFLKSIEPDVAQALATGDVMSLNFLKDRITGRAGRISLRSIHRNRAQVVTIVVATLRTVVGLAL